MSKKGILFVISGPSGCGKGTVLAEILKDENCCYSVSATTRPPRPGEIDGVNYFFLSREEFLKRIESGSMLEYAEFCGNFYGTFAESVDKNLAEGKNVILEIEVKGAENIRIQRPDSVSVFILPPSLSELRRRLHKRGTESDEVINRRIDCAAEEIKQADKYDFVIVNGELNKTVDDLREVMKTAAFMSKVNGHLIDEVLENA